MNMKRMLKGLSLWCKDRSPYFWVSCLSFILLIAQFYSFICHYWLLFLIPFIYISLILQNILEYFEELVKNSEVQAFKSLEKKGIYRELKNYVTMASPDYAFFINGEWGSGKTYFIKHWQKIHLKEQYRASYYVSLYGITDFEKLSVALEDAVNVHLKIKPIIWMSSIFRHIGFKGSHNDLVMLFADKPENKTLIFF